jgi:predicted nucleic-acid-binding Zn-ribbon protein
VSSIHLPANGKCPKCGATIPFSRIEPHPTKDIAFHYYDCLKCGPVLVKVYDISIPGKSKASPEDREG